MHDYYNPIAFVLLVKTKMILKGFLHPQCKLKLVAVIKSSSETRDNGHMSAAVRLHAQSECLRVQSTRQAGKVAIIWMTKQLLAFNSQSSQSRQVPRLVSIKAHFPPPCFSFIAYKFGWRYSSLLVAVSNVPIFYFYDIYMQV